MRTITRTRTLLLGALAAAALAAAGSGLAATTNTVNGTVGPGFTIGLTMQGKKVTKLKAGKYTFVVHDKSSIHNFTVEQEKGGKFEKHLTTTPFVGTKSVTITLKKGKWKFYCSNHESTMFGFFTVTS